MMNCMRDADSASACEVGINDIATAFKSRPPLSRPHRHRGFAWATTCVDDPSLTTSRAFGVTSLLTAGLTARGLQAEPSEALEPGLAWSGERHLSAWCISHRDTPKAARPAVCLASACSLCRCMGCGSSCRAGSAAPDALWAPARPSAASPRCLGALLPAASSLRLSTCFPRRNANACHLQQQAHHSLSVHATLCRHVDSCHCSAAALQLLRWLASVAWMHHPLRDAWRWAALQNSFSTHLSGHPGGSAAATRATFYRVPLHLMLAPYWRR